MSLRSDGEKKIKITINVFEKDWEWFRNHYTKTGASKAVRTLLRNHCASAQKKIADRRNEMDVEVDLG